MFLCDPTRWLLISSWYEWTTIRMIVHSEISEVALAPQCGTGLGLWLSLCIDFPGSASAGCRSIWLSFRFWIPWYRAFVCKVVQLRSSTASRYRAYEIFHMKTRKHVRSSTSWYGAVFFWVVCLDIRIQNQEKLVYQYCRNNFVSVWQLLSRMPWRSAGNGSGSTASWHRVSACNSVSHLEVSKQLDLSAPVVEGIVGCCTCSYLCISTHNTVCQGRERLFDHSCRHDHQRSRVESGARRRYQEGLRRQRMLEWPGPHYLSAPLQFQVHRAVAVGRCRDLQTYGSSVGAAWKHQSGA